MHEVLVKRLGGLSLPRKSVGRLTDRPDMTLDVYRGHKTTMQQQQPREREKEDRQATREKNCPNNPSAHTASVVGSCHATCIIQRTTRIKAIFWPPSEVKI